MAGYKSVMWDASQIGSEVDAASSAINTHHASWATAVTANSRAVVAQAAAASAQSVADVAAGKASDASSAVASRSANWDKASDALSKATIAALTQRATGGLKPDLTLILDIPVEQGLARAGRRIEASLGPAEDRYERMGLAFHERLRRGFRAIAKAEPRRCKVIDASGRPNEVAEQIWAVVAKRFKL